VIKLRLSASIFELTRKKKINKLGDRVITKKNPFLNVKGGFNLIEIFPAYEKKEIRKRR